MHLPPDLLGGIVGFATACAGTVTAGVGVWAKMRTSNSEVMQQASDGWENLASVQTKENDLLANRLATAEGEIKTLSGEYKKVCEYNLSLQDRNSALDRENHALRVESIELKEQASEARALKRLTDELKDQIDRLRRRVLELEKTQCVSEPSAATAAKRRTRKETP